MYRPEKHLVLIATFYNEGNMSCKKIIYFDNSVMTKCESCVVVCFAGSRWCSSIECTPLIFDYVLMIICYCLDCVQKAYFLWDLTSVLLTGWSQSKYIKQDPKSYRELRTDKLEFLAYSETRYNWHHWCSGLQMAIGEEPAQI